MKQKVISLLKIFGILILFSISLFLLTERVNADAVDFILKDKFLYSKEPTEEWKSHYDKAISYWQENYSEIYPHYLAFIENSTIKFVMWDNTTTNKIPFVYSRYVKDNATSGRYFMELSTVSGNGAYFIYNPTTDKYSFYENSYMGTILNLYSANYTVGAFPIEITNNYSGAGSLVTNSKIAIAKLKKQGHQSSEYASFQYQGSNYSLGDFIDLSPVSWKTEKTFTFNTSKVSQFLLRHEKLPNEKFRYYFNAEEYSNNIFPKLKLETYCGVMKTSSKEYSVAELNKEELQMFGCKEKMYVELSFSSYLPNYETPQDFVIDYKSTLVNDTLKMTTTDQFGVPSVSLPPKDSYEVPGDEVEFVLTDPKTWIPSLINGIVNPILQAFNWLLNGIKDLIVFLFIPNLDNIVEKFEEAKDYVFSKLGFFVELGSFISEFLSASFQKEFPEDYNPLPRLTIEKWGIVDQPIINLTWYSQYRDFIHGFIVFLSFCGLSFKLYKKMPDIIGGGSS